MTREQLKAAGYVEISYGEWVKPTLGTVAATPPEPRQTEHDSASSMEMLRGAKRIRQSSKPLLNKLEEEYQRILIDKSPYANPKVYPQAIRFRLANGAWYKPDLVSWNYGNMRCFEVKGPKGMKGQPKGLMTLKVAAAQYPEVDWYLVWKENGQWQEQLVLP